MEGKGWCMSIFCRHNYMNSHFIHQFGILNYRAFPVVDALWAMLVAWVNMAEYLTLNIHLLHILHINNYIWSLIYFYYICCTKNVLICLAKY
uniref:Uncharacterized protein n=1 Tax=Kalanchoe fedtschenkoi TaxID=63787 RepID=A0A7N0V4D8_KALFE